MWMPNEKGDRHIFASQTSFDAVIKQAHIIVVEYLNFFWDFFEIFWNVPAADIQRIVDSVDYSKKHTTQ